jgi:hypothetical protein
MPVTFLSAHPADAGTSIPLPTKNLGEERVGGKGFSEESKRNFRNGDKLEDLLGMFRSIARAPYPNPGFIVDEGHNIPASRYLVPLSESLDIDTKGLAGWRRTAGAGNADSVRDQLSSLVNTDQSDSNQRSKKRRKP